MVYLGYARVIHVHARDAKSTQIVVFEKIYSKLHENDHMITNY